MIGLKEIHTIAGNYNAGDIAIELMDKSQYANEMFIAEAISFLENGNNVLFCTSDIITSAKAEKRINKICNKNLNSFKFKEINNFDDIQGLPKRLNNLIQNINLRGDNVNIVFIDFGGFLDLFQIEELNILNFLKEIGLKTSTAFILKFNSPNDRVNTRMKSIIKMQKEDVKVIYLIRNYGNILYYNFIFLNNKLSSKQLKINYQLNIKKLKMKTKLNLNDSLKLFLQDVKAQTFTLFLIKNEEMVTKIILKLGEMYSSIGQRTGIFTSTKNTNVYKNENVGMGSLNTWVLPVANRTVKDILTTIDDNVSFNELDAVIIDDIFKQTDFTYEDASALFEGLRFLSVKNDCIILTGEQSRVVDDELKITDIRGSMAKAAVSDIIVGVSTSKIKWYIKLLNWLLMRKSKNEITMTMLKNRYGHEEKQYNFIETK